VLEVVFREIHGAILSNDGVDRRLSVGKAAISASVTGLAGNAPKCPACSWNVPSMRDDLGDGEAASVLARAHPAAHERFPLVPAAFVHRGPNPVMTSSQRHASCRRSHEIAAALVERVEEGPTAGEAHARRASRPWEASPGRIDSMIDRRVHAA
jgi:hypothetical protein